ncbi:DUF6443 domain-containing protein [Dyadobacter sp. LHD-138]|uniref:RHS repeat domain-containing protein n=1 Tax=Dyadobacter sp. LHD-138 TaxID=3071413 RepID=UPI0027E190A1|nr:DUF6443 domain-containing protein [Dyadobacter sp. LHD-138]MDQ6479995.1 DUF6443 domain-containing protein [Dyadobacter sp. LHD-138]
MKYTILFILLLLVVLPVLAQQSNDQNYVLTRTFKQAGANVNDVSKVVNQVQYLDGLARPILNVTVGQNPVNWGDMIQNVTYDPLGRQPLQYLPYTLPTSTGGFNGAIGNVTTWYSNNYAKLKSDDLGRPYNETFFEQSPLNRPSGQRAPGNKSANSSIQYKVNDGSEVKRYDYAGGTVTQNGTYAAGTLTRQQSKDEQQNETNIYTDKLGQMVCKKIQASNTETLITYYVYDDLKLLRAVLQPNYQNAAAPSLTDHAFTYDYDELGRVIVKKIPGAGTFEIVYDQYDRPTLSRDANQLARGVWGFTKFDALNRPVATGEISSTDSRATWATNVNTGAQHHEDRDNAVTAGYSLNKTVPTTATVDHLLTITFYDDYGFTKAAGLAYANVYYPANNGNVKGQQTGGRARILPGGSPLTGDWLSSAVYYDGEYRVIQTVRELHDLGASATERVSTEYKYDLAAVASRQKTEQIVSTGTNSLLVEYTHDHADRILDIKETASFGGSPPGSKTKTAHTVAMRYNPLGQLQSKWFHAYYNPAASGPVNAVSATKFRRRTSYVNNIRGWLTSATTSYLKKQGDPNLTYYAFALAYDNAANYTNGNISQMMFRGNAVETYTKGLSFTYDKASRLTESVGIGGYADTESGITYDGNGNIKTLSRAGASVDNLIYTYPGEGNRLGSVNDGSGNGSGVRSGASGYTYDANGNMLTDDNRGATLTYNYLNLPKTISAGGKTYTYDYDAIGNKHKYAGDTITTKYARRFEYNQNNVLRRIATSEGQVVPSGDTLRFDYLLKDHLGNVRAVFDEKGNTLQLSDFYPFGGSISRDGSLAENARNGFNGYLYNGKELQVGTGLLDYGARMYMPEIGRWGVNDPLSEQARRYSPYSYANDNPLIFIDPDGMKVVSIEGGTRYTEGDAAQYWEQLVQEQNERDKKRGHKKDASKSEKELSKTQATVTALGSTATLSEGVTALGWDAVLNGLSVITRLGSAIGVMLMVESDTKTEKKKEEGVTLYRGVHRGHPDYKNAIKGRAVPWGINGGHANPERHAGGATYSIFTSWSLTKFEALKNATGSGPGGVILEKRFSITKDGVIPQTGGWFDDELEYLVPGIVNGAKVQVVK